MSFIYSNILDKTPCFVLIKNLRYLDNSPENPIESGEIILFSDDLTSLMAELTRPTLDFDSKEKLKYFLHSMGFFSDLQQFHGEELIQRIEAKSLSEIDTEINDELSIDAVLNILFEIKKLKKWEVMFDIGGTAYRQKNKLRDYEFFSETYDIRFFGGENQTVIFEFITAYFEKNRLGSDVNLLLTEIRFDFFEMMDVFNGKIKIHSYDLWHEFLTHLNQNNLINDEVYELQLKS